MNENILKSKLNKKIIITAIVLTLTLITVPSVSAVHIYLHADYDGGINGAITTVSDYNDSSNSITLHPGTYNKTTDRNNNINFNDKNLTIQCTEPVGSVIIDADKSGRIFTISGNSNITFINITFINGNSDFGGAIYNSGGIITLINCRFINNTATELGGAICNGYYSNMAITGSSFTDNTASYGGAISNIGRSNMTIADSSFTDNTASYGGAIFNYIYSNMTITGSSFTDNTASSGGAIYNDYYSNMTIMDSNFTHNTANEDGGAIYNSGSANMTITGSSFTDNTANEDSGAIYNNGPANMTITGSSFTDNAASYGGAIYNDYYSNMTIMDSNFTNNTANEDGGAIYNNGPANMTIMDSSFTDNTASYGGAIYNSGRSNITIMDSSFTDNTANEDGGAIFNYYYSNIDITGSSFTDNTASYGGAIYNIGRTTMTITGSSFTYNTANEDGGAIYNSVSANMTITGSNFTNNTANDDGGAIFNYYYSNIAIAGSSFTDNTANEDGGAIYNDYYSNMTITDSNFTSNTVNNNGGAIRNFDSTMTVTDSNLTSNTANNDGGAIDFDNGILNVNGCNFINNTANNNGNALSIRNLLSVKINYNRFVNNKTGYAVYIDDASGTGWDIDYNWWGFNGFDSNVAPDNYYEVKFTNITSLENKTIGNEVVFEYNLVLNGTDDSTGVDKLPYFTSTILYNEDTMVFDARNFTTLRFDLEKTNNTFESITDNATFRLNIAAFDPNTTLTVSASEIVEGKETNIQVTLKDADGNPLSDKTVYITINNKTYQATTNSEGIAIFKISDLKTGNYLITASYEGDDTYLSSSATGNQIVTPYTCNTTLSVSASEIVEGKETNIRVTLKDADGNPLSDKTVYITINNKTYQANTNSEGIAIFKISDLKTGNYLITASYEGDDTYLSSSATGNQIVTPYTSKTTLTVSASTIDEGKKTNIQVTLKDATGKALAEQTVYITINKKTYSAITNSKGVATFKIANLKAAKYTITASYKGNSTYLSSTKSATQTVKAKVDLAIVKATVVKATNKKVMVYKITIQNKGSQKSKNTILQIQHIRKNGYKSKIKTVKVKALYGGAKTTITVKFYNDRTYHKYCKKQFIVVNPKKTMNEITYTNNKKTMKT